MLESQPFKASILSEFFKISSLCTERYGSRSQLATETDSCIQELLEILEAVLSHGLKNEEQEKAASSSLFSLRQVGEFANSIVFGPCAVSGPVMWDYAKKFMSRHEYERYLVLQHVFTDLGRGRAWLRTALNEHSLERYLTMMIADDIKLAKSYEEWAFMRDLEKVSQLIDSVAGLTKGILFALTIDKSELDRQMPALSKFPHIQNSGKGEESENVLVATRAFSPPKSGSLHRPKKKPVKIVMTFDDEPPASQPTLISASQVASETLSRSCGSPNLGLAWKSPQKSRSSSDLTDRRFVEGEMERGGDDYARLELVNPDGNVLLPLTGENLRSGPRGVANKTLESVCLDHSSASSANEQEEQLKELDQKLGLASEENVRLKAEMSAVKQSSEDAAVCYEIRIKTLSRENELLKAQLKKYVSAVQLLKHDGEQAHDTLERLKDLNQVKLKNAELEKYEEKLVQVAEMHAELMEFNTRLQRSLQQKEATIRRLQSELIELRGPLPVDNMVTVEEDSFSLVSEDDGMGLGSSRTLISIWIPSAFLARNSGSEHHVYQIYIRIRDEEWNVYRRYSQFYSLHKQLIKEDPLVGTFDFPPKKTVGYKESKCVEDRRKRLQSYLRAVLNFWVTKYPELCNTPDKETLLGLLPFFGDASQHSRCQSPRGRFPACLRGSQPDVQRVTTPQYDGL